MINDEKLFQLCKKYGKNALLWRRKFIGLLPEVNRRRLFEKKGFTSIFEFAAKLAGLSQDQVRTVLNLEKRFEDKPVLKNILVNGEVSVNKLARVAAIATPENEKILAEQVKLLPQKALETLVRDEKLNVLPEPFFEGKSLRAQTFELADDIKQQLQDFQEKGIDPNELLRALLAEHKQKIAQQKEQISAETKPAKSRYIPIKIKRIIKQEYGKKCSIQSCKKSSKQIHHTQRLALAHTHDPHYLAPLCNEHHLIAHSVDVRVHEVRFRL